jgi:hypothetical protein
MALSHNTVTLRLTQEQADFLEICKDKGLSKSYIVRVALTKFLRADESKLGDQCSHLESNFS